ncbi:MAG TPA: aldose epimerase family protein [Solirubrobacteraceae bacterium]|nr:aldose epimerase family protein [Solirubrobacteraceae bacterium]
MRSALRTRRPLLTGSVVVALTAVLLGMAGSAQGRVVSHHRQSSHSPRHSDRFGGRPNISKPQFWGTADGQNVYLYTLTSGNGMTVNITTYGGVVQSIWVPNGQRHTTNVALGFPKLSDYVNDFTQGANQTPWPLPGGSGDTFFGAIIGRYANRIAGASFDLNNTTYKLDANNGSNTLHGGYLGWNTQVWTPSTSADRHGASLQLTDTFPDGDGCDMTLTPGCTGFPATVDATVTYLLTRDNQLKISYSAVNKSSSLQTVINLTNHTYFNLAGEGTTTVYHQLLAMNSDDYTPVNTNLIPESPFFVPVGGTAYDFRSMHPIGQNIRNTNLPDGESGPFKQLQIAHGYDNNWVLNGYPGYRLVSVAQDPKNGVTLWTYTDQPGVQMYSGNFLVGDLIGTSGNVYRQGDGFTLETQHYPDSPHHIGDSQWPTVVLDPGATFTSTTAYKFSVEGRNLKNEIHFH